MLRTDRRPAPATEDAILRTLRAVAAPRAVELQHPYHGQANDTGDSATRRLQSACTAGTTASYADENLGFRFRSENMTTDEHGLRWDAAVPAGLAFTMFRPSDPVGDSTGGWFSEGNGTEPSTVAPAGVPDGIHFESGQDADYHQIMWSNRKVAVGAANTFFAVVTPASTAQMFDGLVSFRPSNAPGVFGWLMATSGCPNTGHGDAHEGAVGCMFVDDWSPSGFFGPPFHGGVTQIAIYRSRLTHNALVRRPFFLQRSFAVAVAKSVAPTSGCWHRGCLHQLWTWLLSR